MQKLDVGSRWAHFAYLAARGLDLSWCLWAPCDGTSWWSWSSTILLCLVMSYLINSILEHLKTSEQVRHEDHTELITTLNKIHYFQCHVQEFVVVVWRDQNLLSQKVENLEV